MYTHIIAVNSDYIPEFHTCKLPHSGLKTGCTYATITRPLPAVYYVETSVYIPVYSVLFEVHCVTSSMWAIIAFHQNSLCAGSAPD